MADFAFLSIPELGRLLRTKRTSATELAGYFLDRLERIGPRFNAVVTVTRERALAEAAQADREIGQGKWRGPLHGIPYGVKDLLATKDYPTTWGAEPYRQQKFDADATVVERLGASGAVLVAKLAMVELAGGMGYNQANASFTGPGKTPWNPGYWSGGSSSGPGAAVAAGLVPFAIGAWLARRARGPLSLLADAAAFAAGALIPGALLLPTLARYGLHAGSGGVLRNLSFKRTEPLRPGERKPPA